MTYNRVRIFIHTVGTPLGQLITVETGIGVLKIRAVDMHHASDLLMGVALAYYAHVFGEKPKHAILNFQCTLRAQAYALKWL